MAERDDFAVFIDRDGTMVFDMHYLADPEGLELIATVPEGVKKLNEAGIPVIVVTNQSGVARGRFDETALDRIHRRLAEMLMAKGAKVDGIYYCPHMPDAGCDCRKPRPGMLRRAGKERGFDLRRSYVIGDRMMDIEMAHSVGAIGVLVPEPGDQYHVDSEIETSKDTPDMRKATFIEAVEWVLRDIARKSQ
jgi:D-glycero-D-manno-heptose 1,7-bisphosphate phosphatase